MKTEKKNKKQIIQELNSITNELVNFYQDLPHEKSIKSTDGKWSIDDNIEHLINSIKPLTKALNVPKLILKWKFGKMNRDRKTAKEISDKYTRALSKGFSIPNPFGPKNIGELDKNKLIKEYLFQTKRLIESLDNWSEDQLDIYILPHPLIGKLSIREMLYFTCLHTNHHLNTIRTTKIR